MNSEDGARAMHPGTAPSPWIVRYGRAFGRGHTVLDIACGSGRHVRHFLAQGCHVTGVDRGPDAAAGIRCGRFERVVQDLEDGSPWPFPKRTFDAVIVTNYLHRPLFPHIVAAVAVGGRMLYETFAVGNERFGRPSDPRFLLRRGELLAAVGDSLRVLAYEDVVTPRPARVQRIAAVRDTAGSAGRAAAP